MSKLSYNNSITGDNSQAIKEVLENTTSFSINQTRRNYFSEKKFYGINYKLSAYNSFDSGITNGNIRYFNNSFNSWISIPLTFGFGRIEPVTDAWHAVRILQDLDDLSTLTRAPTSREVYELAEVLSDLRYYRIFDFRLGRIRRIKALDEYFYKTGLVKDHDSVYFTSLYDMYLFGIQSTRFSGERVTFGLVPEAIISYPNIRTIFTKNQYALLGMIAYAFNYPINQWWQLDINTSIKGGYVYTDNSFAPNYFSFIPYFDIQAGYYPTSRTTFMAKLTIRGKYGPIDSQKSLSFFFAGLQGSMYYYFSPRTALNLKMDYNYSRNNNNDLFSTINAFDGFQFNYSIRLVHSFF